MIDNFESLKREVEKLQGRRERVIGARGQLLKRLKEKFGIESLKEAEKELLEAQEEERVTARRYTQRRELFEKEFREKLKQLED